MPVGPPNTHPGGPLVGGSGVANIPYPAGASTSGTIQLPGQAQQTPRQDAYGPQRPYQGDHVVFFNDSDSGLTIALPSGASLPCPPGHILDMMIEPGDSTAQWSILYQNPYQVHPAEALTAAFYSAADLQRGYVLPSGTLNPSTPAAAIGPGALPAGVTDNNDDVFGALTIQAGGLDTDVFIGVASEAALNQFVGLQSATMESGIFDGVTGHTVIAKGVGNLFFGVNGYFDGVNERYITSAAAYQLNFSRANGWRFRFSTDVSPTAGNVITWSAFVQLVDTSGNRFADGPSVVGDVAANQVGPGNLDADVNLTGAIEADILADANSSPLRWGLIIGDGSGWRFPFYKSVLGVKTIVAEIGDLGQLSMIGGQASAGSFGAPVIVAQVLDQTITTTGSAALLTYAVPTDGLYVVYGHFTHNNSGGSTLCTFGPTYTDPHGSNPGVPFMTAIGANPVPVNNLSFANGVTVPCLPVTMRAKGGTNIVVNFNDASGTPNDSVTIVLMRLT